MAGCTRETAKEYLDGERPRNLTGWVRDKSSSDAEYRFEEGDEVYVLLEESSHHDGWTLHSVRGGKHYAPTNPSKASASVRVTLRRLDDGRWVGTDPFVYQFCDRGSIGF